MTTEAPPSATAASSSAESEPRERTDRIRWAIGVIASTSAISGGWYLILYEAADQYYARFGMTPEQGGLSRERLAGTSLLVGIFFAVLLIGVLLMVVVHRWLSRTREDRHGVFLRVVVGVGLIVELIFLWNWRRVPVAGSLVVYVVTTCWIGAVAALMLPVPVGAAPSKSVGRVEGLRVWCSRHIWAVVASSAIVLGAVGMFWLWETAYNAGGDVLVSGTSNQKVLTFPVVDVLGVRPMWVSPCLIPLGGGYQTVAHLRAAVIVGRSAGRTYLVGVAGLDGFQRVPPNDPILFSVADSDLGVLDLRTKMRPSSWGLGTKPDTTGCA